MKARIGNAIGPYERPPDFSKKALTKEGTGTSNDHLDWPRLSYREQFKEGDEEADRGNDGKTTS